MTLMLFINYEINSATLPVCTVVQDVQISCKARLIELHFILACSTYTLLELTLHNVFT